jgi:DNA-binding transcriptional LysR family regulator
MLDGVSLDQLRAFVTAVDAGSFSAAARRLNRVQSAVSGWVGALEAQIGVALFDRDKRYPVLTPAGRLLLADARQVLAGVDTIKARSRLLAAGMESELAVVIDVFVPIRVVSAAARAFALQFPLTPLRLVVDALGAAYQPVRDGACSLGILAALPVPTPDLVSEPIGTVALMSVAAATHPLAAITGPLRAADLAPHVQLVLTDKSPMLAGRDYGVVSSSTWRMADLSTKHALLREGLGWGSMPEHMVAPDLAQGTFVELDIEGKPHAYPLPIGAYYRGAAPPGPAGRWFIDRIRQLWSDDAMAR